MAADNEFQVIGDDVEFGGIRVATLRDDIPASLRHGVEQALHGDMSSDTIAEMDREISSLEDELKGVEQELYEEQDRVGQIENVLDDEDLTDAERIEDIRAILRKIKEPA